MSVLLSILGILALPFSFFVVYSILAQLICLIYREKENEK